MLEDCDCHLTVRLQLFSPPLPPTLSVLVSLIMPRLVKEQWLPSVALLHYNVRLFIRPTTVHRPPHCNWTNKDICLAQLWSPLVSCEEPCLFSLKVRI